MNSENSTVCETAVRVELLLLFVLSATDDLSQTDTVADPHMTDTDSIAHLTLFHQFDAVTLW